MMNHCRLFVVLLMMASQSYSQSVSQSVSFYREDLDFRLSEYMFEVDGWYYFRNNTNKEISQIMIYPFPDTLKYGEILYVRVSGRNDTTSQPVKQSKFGATFMLHIAPYDTTSYRISYGQRNKCNEARYIITTTKSWGERFKKASYNLKIMPEISLETTSIKPDSVVQKSDCTYYYWYRENFMPDTDFLFNFKPKP